MPIREWIHIHSKLMMLVECMLSSDIHELADQIQELTTGAIEIDEILKPLAQAAWEFDTSWSGSQLGYHSRVYYKNFDQPPPDASFSTEWGLIRSGLGKLTVGSWIEYQQTYVRQQIYSSAGDPALDKCALISTLSKANFVLAKTTALSVMALELELREDPFIRRMLNDIDTLSIPEVDDILWSKYPNRGIASRDQAAGSEGFKHAPHQIVLAEIDALRMPFEKLDILFDKVQAASQHIERRNALVLRDPAGISASKRIFIGHGRSKLWLELKDYIQDDLMLPWDEFNRIPTAGMSTTERLNELLDSAGFALLILTAEDEQIDGTRRARENVVHEAGLFQGRLGFRKAIILLEDGCEEFSNITGLTQIRFPPGNIKAQFLEIQRVLKREGLI